jgi:hypothetical protein
MEGTSVTDEQMPEFTEPDGAVTTDEAPQYGVGPFTIREVALFGVWLVAFVVSFFPVYSFGVLNTALGGGQSVWTAGLDWVLTIGVPTAAVFLVILRRLSPEGIRRVGSLGVDQFASVAFSVAALVWLTWLWQNVALVIGSGVWIRSWVVWVEFILALAGVVLTVLAPVIAPFRDDFRGRPEAIAHRNARAVRPVTARPPRPTPEPIVAAAPQDLYAPPAGPPTDTAAYNALGLGDTGAYDFGGAPAAGAGTGDWGPQYLRSSSDEVQQPVSDLSNDTAGYRRSGGFVDAEPVAAQAVGSEQVGADPAGSAAHVHQAFWALAPVERDVYDERGVPIFRIGPTAWALVIEDRGSLFVIRHEDGRIGYLHDITGVTRG